MRDGSIEPMPKKKKVGKLDPYRHKQLPQSDVEMPKPPVKHKKTPRRANSNERSPSPPGGGYHSMGSPREVHDL